MRRGSLLVLIVIFFVILFVIVGGCTSPSSLIEAPRSAKPTPSVDVAPQARAPARTRWVDTTKSPWPVEPAGDSREAGLTTACGVPDGALGRVAAKLAEERVRGHGLPDPDRAALLLREHGEPHTRPRVVTASGRGPLDDESLRTQLAAIKREGMSTRCGVALARTEQGKEMLVAVVIEALADLQAIPTRARTGEWLTLAASVHVAIANAKVVILGPRGLPRTVPTSIDRASGLVRARFALDRPGAFTVQLLGDLAGGPQPLLEARIFADVEPFTSDETSAPGAPGEESASGVGDDVSALARMTTALRASESLPPLIRDERLDALARAHAEKMRSAGSIAHDLGDGDLTIRFEAAGLAAKAVGENVARAQSALLAHRALHASPSHRMNLLRADYTHIGLAVVGGASQDSDDTTVYVCEIFAAGMR